LVAVTRNWSPESGRRKNIPQKVLSAGPVIDEFDATKSQGGPIFIDRYLSNSIKTRLP